MKLTKKEHEEARIGVSAFIFGFVMCFLLVIMVILAVKFGVPWFFSFVCRGCS